MTLSFNKSSRLKWMWWWFKLYFFKCSGLQKELFQVLFFNPLRCVHCHPPTVKLRHSRQNVTERCRGANISFLKCKMCNHAQTHTFLQDTRQYSYAEILPCNRVVVYLFVFFFCSVIIITILPTWLICECVDYWVCCFCHILRVHPQHLFTVWSAVLVTAGKVECKITDLFRTSQHLSEPALFRLPAGLHGQETTLYIYI